MTTAQNARAGEFHFGTFGEFSVAIDTLEDALARLDTIPGVDRQPAEVLLAESGAAMVRFPTAGHLASWAGKRRSGKTRKGSTWLRRALTEAAHGAARTKQRGRSALAGGHRILVIAYHVLRDRREDHEPTPLALDEHRRLRARNRALDQLRQLGFAVTLTPKAGAA